MHVEIEMKDGLVASQLVTFKDDELSNLIINRNIYIGCGKTRDRRFSLRELLQITTFTTEI